MDPKYQGHPPPYSPNPNYNENSSINPYYPNYAYHEQQVPPLPPPGFQTYPVQTAPGPTRTYGATVITIPQSSEIILVGGCPACRVGVLEDDFTCLGIFCAIFFFPLGILCCLALKDKRCTNCGAYFG